LTPVVQAKWASRFGFTCISPASAGYLPMTEDPERNNFRFLLADRRGAGRLANPLGYR
jgi:hypothetical protein